MGNRPVGDFRWSISVNKDGRHLYGDMVIGSDRSRFSNHGDVLFVTPY